ncbi:hypothetical protein K449DRAFT_440515 [Hypoxylon sp. EC38]|nr:hypothetical protein K449DRAFT_440515 [Hypoxylon sp. EC38]
MAADHDIFILRFSPITSPLSTIKQTSEPPPAVLGRTVEFAMYESDSAAFECRLLFVGATTRANKINHARSHTLFIFPIKEVAASVEASIARQVEIMVSIMGFMSLCGILLWGFFLYHFCRPPKKVDVESTTEIHSVNEENKKKWWIDDSEMKLKD